MTQLSYHPSIHSSLPLFWHHDNAQAELLEFLVDKPPLKAIQIRLHLLVSHPDPNKDTFYTVDLTGDHLTPHLLEALQFSYSAPSDLEGVISFEDGSWAQHAQGQWQLFTNLPT